MVKESIAEGYKEQPEESWKKIVKQIRKYFPETRDRELYKVLGFRHVTDRITECQ